ncbi:Na(+)/H(+) antiporter subunit B [Poriferisphaera corsica]|uniref:Na(+)/H(+) antiporter subunit B n=1 Tax=Poriferisphaera corsica TaxID=2528020 RepID=A0A517YUA7_9BACT|nr:MnhB domain-containing protein [Poriferisphaera corsica]QDU33796.1 Na(+)/H(+) antiporter subunit B [Poriferisphaera corsica]
MTSLILKTAMRLIVPLAMLFAAYMALKGHNEPGGGFIGGLIASVSLALYRMTYGVDSFDKLFPIHPRILVFVGLTCAVLTAIFPLLLGRPLLTSYEHYLNLGFGQSVHFVTAAIFDIGVLLVVVGVSVGMIDRLSREVEKS